MATYRENGGAWREFDGDVARLVSRIGHEVADDAQRFAPVDTGLLKSSIAADSVTHGPTGWSVRVWARTHYAVFVENGTSRMRARPYLRPALFKHRGA